MTSTRSDNQIKAGLYRIRVLRAWAWGIWFGFFPSFFLLEFIQPPEWLLMTIGLFWFCSWFVMALISAFSRCPACHHLFFIKRKLPVGNPFARKCLNCGIPLNYSERKANGDGNKNIN